VQTRDCRGGKSEKEIFYQLFINLYKHYPETVLKMLTLIPEYGYYKDYFRIIESVTPGVVREKKEPSSFSKFSRSVHNKGVGNDKQDGHIPVTKIDLGNTQSQLRLTDTIVGIVAAQLLKDEVTFQKYVQENARPTDSAPSGSLAESVPNQIIYTPKRETPLADRLSNLAKWAPRCNRYYADGCLTTSFHKLQHTMYPNEAYHTGQSESNNHNHFLYLSDFIFR
jgi:hypothetical protein